MNLTRLERSESDLKHKRYRNFKLKHLCAHNFKINLVNTLGPYRDLIAESYGKTMLSLVNCNLYYFLLLALGLVLAPYIRNLLLVPSGELIDY